MRLVIAAMAVAIATPVVAQDMAGDFREAYTRTYGEGPPGALSAAEVGLSILPTIAGNWLRGDIIAEQPDLDLDQLAQFCDGPFSIRIENAGNFGFTTETIRRGEGQGDLRTFMFASGRYFGFVSDLDGVVDRLFGSGASATAAPSQILDLVSGTSGMARVEMVGSDVLMIDSPTAAPMIFVRCT